MGDPPTLFEWAGGDAALTRLLDCFYDRIVRDDLISPLFPGGVSQEHRDHVTAWWREVFGGSGGVHRLALHNSQPGADVVTRAPVPRWGWGEAPPYLG